MVMAEIMMCSFKIYIQTVYITFSLFVPFECLKPFLLSSEHYTGIKLLDEEKSEATKYITFTIRMAKKLWSLYLKEVGSL